LKEPLKIPEDPFGFGQYIKPAKKKETSKAPDFSQFLKPASKTKTEQVPEPLYWTQPSKPVRKKVVAKPEDSGQYTPFIQPAGPRRRTENPSKIQDYSQHSQPADEEKAPERVECAQQ
jgi:hypothetical protein